MTERLEQSQERTLALAKCVSEALKVHYENSPPGPASVFEALNAIAIATAPILGGVDRPEATSYFMDALFSNIENVKAEAKGAVHGSKTEH